MKALRLHFFLRRMRKNSRRSKIWQMANGASSNQHEIPFVNLYQGNSTFAAIASNWPWVDGYTCDRSRRWSTFCFNKYKRKFMATFNGQRLNDSIEWHKFVFFSFPLLHEKCSETISSFLITNVEFIFCFSVQRTRSHKCFSIMTNYTLGQVVCSGIILLLSCCCLQRRIYSKRLVNLREPDVVIHGLRINYSWDHSVRYDSSSSSSTSVSKPSKWCLKRSH